MESTAWLLNLVLLSTLLLWCADKVSATSCFQCTNDPDNVLGWNVTDACTDDHFEEDDPTLARCTGPGFCKTVEIFKEGQEEIVTRSCSYELPYEGCKDAKSGSTTVTTCYCVGDECNEAHVHGAENNCIACKSQAYIFGVAGAELSDPRCEDALLPADGESTDKQKGLGGCHSETEICGKMYTLSTYGTKVYRRFCTKEPEFEITEENGGCQVVDKGNVAVTTCYCKGAFCNAATANMANVSILALLVACVAAMRFIH